MEALPPLGDQLVHNVQLGCYQFLSLIPAPHQQGPLEQAGPALCHFPFTPLMGNVGLHLEYQMIVIAHHGIGADADGKDLRQLAQLVGNPLASVLVALA
ncbi:hypothetical protein D3C86_1863300 [compost metagenome]